MESMPVPPAVEVVLLNVPSPIDNNMMLKDGDNDATDESLLPKTHKYNDDNNNSNGDDNDRHCMIKKKSVVDYSSSSLLQLPKKKKNPAAALIHMPSPDSEQQQESKQKQTILAPPQQTDSGVPLNDEEQPTSPMIQHQQQQNDQQKPGPKDDKSLSSSLVAIPLLPPSDEEDDKKKKKNRLSSMERATLLLPPGVYKYIIPRFPLPPTDVIEIPVDDTACEVSIVTTPEHYFYGLGGGADSLSSLPHTTTSGPDTTDADTAPNIDQKEEQTADIEPRSMSDKLKALKAEVKAMEYQLQIKLEEKNRILRVQIDNDDVDLNDDDCIGGEEGLFVRQNATTTITTSIQKEDEKEEEKISNGSKDADNSKPEGKPKKEDTSAAVAGQSGCFDCLQRVFCGL